MKLNISYPATGCQKLFEVEDEKKLKIFYEKRMGHEINADPLGEEWKGYVFRISGGNDKQGFPMKQGVLTTERVRLLLSKGHSCYRPRKKGERKRKSVRGCIVDANLSVLALVIVKKGLGEITGLTDTSIPRKLGPKRASKIRKLFNLDKNDDVRRYVIRHPLPFKEGRKPKTKAPKIQRLLTPSVLQHRRQKIKMKQVRREKNKEEAADYAKLLAQRRKEAREKLLKKNRRSSKRNDKLGKGKKATKKKAASDKKAESTEAAPGESAETEGVDSVTTKKLEKSPKTKSSAKTAKPALKTAAGKASKGRISKPGGKTLGEKGDKPKATKKSADKAEGLPPKKPDAGKGTKRPADSSSSTPTAKKPAGKSADTKPAQKTGAPKKEGEKATPSKKEKSSSDKAGSKKDKPSGDKPAAPKKDKPAGSKKGAKPAGKDKK